MAKIVSVFLSLVVFLASQLPGAAGLVDSISIALTGAPYYLLGTDDSFLSGEKSPEIDNLGSGVGLLDNVLLCFLDKKTSLLERYRAFRSVNGVCIGTLAPAGLFVLRAEFDGREEMQALCSRLRENKHVVFASGSFAFRYEPDMTPDDPFNKAGVAPFYRFDEANPSGSTWWAEAVYARDAWGYAPLFNDITLGIVDSGFETDHPELSGKIRFPNALLQRQNRPGSHGTHVAGLIAAKANNGKGISGICPGADLCCVDWEPEEDQHWIEDLRIIFGVGYAVSAGARVVNLSLGSSGSIEEGRSAYPKIYMDTEALLVSAYFGILLSRGYDFVVVQSAGNGDSNGNPVDSFNNGSFCCINKDNAFAGIPGVLKADILNRIIVVGSATNLGSGSFRQSSFSNGGDGVSLCAPGSGIYSCDMQEYGSYAYKSGTSMAAPIVTAVAGLVWSVNPKLSGAQVKAIVCAKENCRYEVPPAPNPYWNSVRFHTLSLVNAKLAVEAAVKTLYATGEISGIAAGRDGRPLPCEIEALAGGRLFVFSAAQDGGFRFILPAGNAELTLRYPDGSKANRTVEVVEGCVIDLGTISS